MNSFYLVLKVVPRTALNKRLQGQTELRIDFRVNEGRRKNVFYPKLKFPKLQFILLVLKLWL